MAAWLLLLAIAIAAIMPHARQGSKREGRAGRAIVTRFPQSGMVE